MAELIVFWIMAALAVPAAMLMISVKNPVHSALYLVVVLFAVAMLFLSLGAQFVAFVQILVYAGAIMVLFLFVIMLLNLTGDIDLLEDRLKVQMWAAPVLAAVLLAMTLGILRSGVFTVQPSSRPDAAFGRTYEVARLLFTKYLFPFELTSVLLLIGMVGAVVLAKRKI